jgi:rubrerythrin
MQRIATRSELIERLKDVLAVEMLALKRYSADAAAFKDSEILNTLKGIVEDEKRHIELLHGLVSR